MKILSVFQNIQKKNREKRKCLRTKLVFDKLNCILSLYKLNYITIIICYITIIFFLYLRQYVRLSVWWPVGCGLNAFQRFHRFYVRTRTHPGARDT